MASRPPVPPRPPGLTPFPRPGAAPVMGAQRLTPPPVPPRPAGLVPSIQGGQIETLVEMGGGGMNPIWLVTMKGGRTKIVVKKEAQFKDEHMATYGAFAQKNIQAISSVMTTISPTAGMTSLSPQELMAIKSFAGTPKSLLDAIPLHTAKSVNLVKMKYDESFTSTSNKGAMPIFDGDQGAMSEQDRAKGMALFESLRGNRTVLQSLGKVFIADALVGNNDRADFGGTGQGVGISNFGNLIFSKAADGTITGALGLDAVDPTANLENMMFGTDIAAWEKGFGIRIKDKNTFNAFTADLIKDINRRRLTPWGMKPFGMVESTALAEGMMIGWDKFANRIGSTVRMGKGIPSGLMARAKYLGWVR